MSEKSAYLISCSDHYDFRLHVLDGCLREQGYHTTYITSNFEHSTKETFVCHVDGSVQIPVRPYQKNLSLDRILSHREFARDVFRYLEALPEPPQLLVVHIPPNFLAHYAAKYKKRNPGVKLIYDVFDLWPETFPGGKSKALLAPAFKVWAAIRDWNLGAADYVVTECEMFRQILKLEDRKSKTVWLSARLLGCDKGEPQLRADALELCYLGSINNVIGISDICGLIRELSASKPVVLHIIGKGERQQLFIEEAQAAGAEVVFHGAVYDEAEKLQIMDRCHFGLNIMKSSVCVGLTMKSVDYFRFGLPIVNSIPGDTRKLVEEEKIGIHLGADCVQKILALTNEDCLRMRRNVSRVFRQCFEQSVIERQYAEVLDQVLGE